MTMNGPTKTLSIIVVTVIAIGSLIWSLSGRSGNLERVVEDVVRIEAQGEETREALTDVEKAVILMQSDIGYMQKDIAAILTLQRRALNISEYTED